METNIRLLLCGTALLIGCATKSYVRQSVDPLQTQVNQVSQQVNQQGAELGQTRQNVERNSTAISATNEMASAADHRATDALNGVKQAQLGIDQNSREIRQLWGAVANIDDYKVSARATLLFPVNGATLRDEDKQQLNQLVSSTTSLKRYFVAIAGFTDQTGSAAYNLALSRRRADTVVQYLAGQGIVPFYQIRTIGLGAQQLIDAGISPKDRAKSRRVEVRIYSADPAKVAAARSH